MRVFSLITAAALVCPGIVFAGSITADSKITCVTVYPDAALVTREAQVKLPAGASEVVFPDIIPQVNEDSLKVSSGEKETVRLYAVTLKRDFLEQVPSERIRQLQDELQKLQDAIRGLQNNRLILQEEKNYLDSLRFFSNSQLPKELVTKMPPAAELEATLKFLDVKLRENYAAVLESELQIREAQNKESALRNELQQISGPVRKEKTSIRVELDAQKAALCSLSVSYLVPGVSWQPVYDGRADFAGQEVELDAYAMLSQNTGEDWRDVAISFSTARPTSGGNLPYVSPWILRPFAPRVMAKRSGRDMASQKMAFEGIADTAMLSAAAEAAPAYASVQDRGTAVVYTVNRRVDVKADGSEQKLPIASQKLKAAFEYSSYPRLQQAAFLGSRVANAGTLQLLPGKLNVFLDGEFVGSSELGAVGPGEEFDLYLGADDNVKVKKEQVEKKLDETLIGNIPSPTKLTRLKYKLIVENYKTRPVKVKLFEAMPVAEDDRIKVKLGQVSLEPKKKDWEDRKGVWMWELQLEPKAKQEITYSLVIEHPRDMRIEGL